MILGRFRGNLWEWLFDINCAEWVGREDPTQTLVSQWPGRLLERRYFGQTVQPRGQS